MSNLLFIGSTLEELKYIINKHNLSLEEDKFIFVDPNIPYDLEDFIIKKINYHKIIHTNIYTFLTNVYDLKKDKIDYVFMYRVLEHIDSKILPEIFYLLKDILNENSIIEIIVPDYYDIVDRLVNGKNISIIPLSYEFYGTENLDKHQTIFTENVLRDLLEKEGFYKIKTLKLKQTHPCDSKKKDWYIYCEAEKII